MDINVLWKYKLLLVAQRPSGFLLLLLAAAAAAGARVSCALETGCGDEEQFGDTVA